jgi:signal transduction histidine kinase
MRVALQRSIERAERANAELEQRVEERTAELRRLYRDLQEREEARARLLRKVITAQEDERRRIARDLHDETTQSLAALVMRLQAALAAPQGEAGPRLKEAEALAVHALDEVHRIIVDLRPSVLDDLGLWSAIAWYSDRVLRKAGIAVRCESGCVEHERLPTETRVAVFRAVQEALTNIAKHAEADAVLIQCDVRDGMLTIEIEDDGKGFDAAALAAPGEGGHGWGLLGIRERMEIIGGAARIDSSPGQGTHLVLSVPMPSAKETSA